MDVAVSVDSVPLVKFATELNSAERVFPSVMAKPADLMNAAALAAHAPMGGVVLRGPNVSVWRFASRQ